jgi:hypothetical protein
MAKRTIRYWLVEATKQKATEFFQGRKVVSANELNDLANFRKQLAAEYPNDFWDICTNECVTIYEDFGVKFQNGRFERI